MRKIIGRLAILFVTVAYAAMAIGPLPAAAAATSTITGSVHTAEGVAIGGAEVTLTGAVHLTKSTDAAGNFRFDDVPTGLYTLLVSKGGYQTYRNDGIAAFIGETMNVSVVLAASSFSSLKTIASVSTNAAGVAPIDTSTASISTISSATFMNQGQEQVTKVLNETPGIFTTPYYPGNGNPSNGASPGSAQTPQIRGALPYETESLIDGHPVSVGGLGTFSPTIINPFLLQDVEIVKGPGSMPEEINYAINGTVNYRTLDPTVQNVSEGLWSVDKWGGLSAGFKATGSAGNHKLEYAAGYVTDGAPGPLQNFRYEGSQLPLVTGPAPGPSNNYTSQYYLNGQALAGIPEGIGVSPASLGAYDGMGLRFSEPLTGCCFQMDTGYHSTSELGKIVYNFSNTTSLKLSYLGGQSVAGNGDVNAYDNSSVGTTGVSASVFDPGPSYCPAASGPPCDSAIPFDISSVNGLGYTWTQQNLFQGEFRTGLGAAGTVLARYYTGSLNQYELEGSAPGTPLSYTMDTYGSVALCPTGTQFSFLTGACSNGAAPTPTTFNGQPVTFSTISESNTFTTNDTMSGETLELQEQLGENTVTLAYDRSEQWSTLTADEPSVGIIEYSPAKGSEQTFQTFSLRGTIMLKPKVLLNLGDYAMNYLSHYSLDGDAANPTFNDSSHTYNEPRAALTWQPDNNTIYRLAAGGSVAPPYLSLISSSGPIWSQIVGGVPAAGLEESTNNGNVNAETAFSYDLGADHRIARSTAISADVYFTQLHNLFLTQTGEATGAALATCQATLAALNAPANSPCEQSLTTNLGQARYEGIELALNHAPLFGFGWKLQGSLQRAYTYNLPQYFYCTQPGPGCTYNTNLAVLPNVNFGGVATAVSGAPTGIDSARVPYALGYGELNWTGHYGQYYNLGLQYFGNNNSFNEPPFFVLSANVRLKLNDHGTHLQLSADNLTGAYDNPYVGFFNGIPLPLVKGAMQLNPLYPAVGAEYVPTSFAATPAGNYGPTSYRIILLQDF